MYYYLYKITNLLNNKFYIGVHSTKNLNDNYMGSGKLIRAAIKKYGKENFRKEILEHFENSEQMFLREKEIIIDEFLLRTDTYNIRYGGFGGFDHIDGKLSRISALNKIKSLFENNESWKNATIRKRKEGLNNKLDSDPELKLWFKENGIKASLRAKWLRDNDIEWNNKVSATLSKGQKLRYSTSDHPQLGNIWIYSEELNKSTSIKKELLNDWIAKGWRKGRK